MKWYLDLLINSKKKKKNRLFVLINLISKIESDKLCSNYKLDHNFFKSDCSAL